MVDGVEGFGGGRAGRLSPEEIERLSSRNPRPGHETEQPAHHHTNTALVEAPTEVMMAATDTPAAQASPTHAVPRLRTR